MEARLRSLGGQTQRKPLADCSNTVSSKTSQQQHSSSSSATTLAVKLSNPNLKKLLDQTKLTMKPNATPGSFRPVTRRTVATDLGFPATSPFQGVVSDNEAVFEPYSVYTVRRKTCDGSGIKRTSRDSSSSSCAVVTISGKETNRGNDDESKSFNVAPKKRQRKVKDEEDDLVYGVSQEYIELQRAYFAEVDAFELAEEEVSSSDVD